MDVVVQKGLKGEKKKETEIGGKKILFKGYKIVILFFKTRYETFWGNEKAKQHKQAKKAKPAIKIKVIHNSKNLRVKKEK